MSNKLYVGNLSFDTTEVDLQDPFAEAGTVTEVALMQDKFTGKSRGFAFVTMSTAGRSAEGDQPLPRQVRAGPSADRQRSASARRPRRWRRRRAVSFGGGGGGGERGGGGGGGGGYQKRY